jgi:hypothetical protein
MPSLRTIGYEHGDQATRETYTFAFRGLSPAIHTTSRAFEHGVFEAVGTGNIALSNSPIPAQLIRRHRPLNVTTFAL